MLAFVPVTLDLYRTVRRHLHWTLQNLVGVRRPHRQVLPPLSGRSPRLLGRPGARSRVTWRNWPPRASSRVSGVLAAATPTLSRPASCRRSAGCPIGAIGVSHRREQKNRQVRKPGAHAPDFVDRKVSFGEIPDDHVKWQARLRSWRTSRFWLPLWGPKPGEAGCFAPREVLQGVQQGG